MLVVEEMRDQRRAAVRPALSLATVLHSPTIRWRNGEDTSSPDPIEIEISNFGAGPSLDVSITYKLSAERCDLDRACSYWRHLIRREVKHVSYSKNYWFVVQEPVMNVEQMVAGQASLEEIIQLPHLPPGAKVTKSIPAAIRGGIFLLGLDSASSSMNQAPGVTSLPLPLSSSQGMLEESMERMMRGSFPITLDISINYKSIYEPLTFSAKIDLDARLQLSFLRSDDDGVYLMSEDDLPSNVLPREQRGRIEVPFVWAVHKSGSLRPFMAARSGPIVGVRTTQPLTAPKTVE